MYSIHEVTQIQDRKNEVEAWYHEGFPNYNLIAGLDSPEEHLKELRNLKDEREKLYSKIEEKSQLVLALFLDTILYCPDFIIRKRITKKKRDDKIITERDYLDSERRKAAKRYKKAVDNILKVVERENRKLSAGINPITVKVHNPYNEIESFKHRPQERSIKFIKGLSNVLSLCFESQADRARIIEDVYKFVYGISKEDIYHKTIAKQC